MIENRLLLMLAGSLIFLASSATLADQYFPREYENRRSESQQFRPMDEGGIIGSRDGDNGGYNVPCVPDRQFEERGERVSDSIRGEEKNERRDFSEVRIREEGKIGENTIRRDEVFEKREIIDGARFGENKGDMIPNSVNRNEVKRDQYVVGGGSVQAPSLGGDFKAQAMMEEGRSPCPQGYHPDPNAMMDKGRSGEYGSEENRGRYEQEMRESREREEQRMTQERFSEMKRNMGGLRQGLSMMKKELAPKTTKRKLTKKVPEQLCVFAVPQEVKDAIVEGEKLANQLDKTQTFEEGRELMSEMMDIGDMMREWGPLIGDVTRGCQMLSEANAIMARTEKKLIGKLASFKSKEAKKPEDKRFDVTQIEEEVKAHIETFKTVLADVVKLGASSKPEDLSLAIEKLIDEFFDELPELENWQEKIEMLSNVSKGLSKGASELTKYRRQINSLEKKKAITADEAKHYRDLVSSFDTQMKDIYSTMKQKGFDPDELMDKIEGAFEVREELLGALYEFQGNRPDSQFKPLKGVDPRYFEAFGRAEGTLQ